MGEPSEAESLDSERRAYWQVRPDPLTHMAFARTLTVPDSEDEHGRQEPYDPRSHPGQFHVLQAADGIVNGAPGRPYRRFLLITDAQGGGKSWLLQQIIFHGLIELGQGVIYALPSRGLAGDIWNLKMRPAFAGSGLGMYLPIVGPGSKGASVPRSIKTRILGNRGGGSLAFMASGGRGQSGQAGLTAKRLTVDELGDWQKAAFNRIRKRISRWNQIAVEWYGSTLKHDTNDLTLELYEEGTSGSIEYVCPHCHDFTPFHWDSWRWEGDNEILAAASATIACLKCGALINETQRIAAMANHRLSMLSPDRSIFSIKLTALDCPWKSLGWLAGEEFRAIQAKERGDHEPLRAFYHDERVQIYAGDLGEDGTPVRITCGYLAARSKVSTFALNQGKEVHDEEGDSIHIAEKPDGVEFLTVTEDVQQGGQRAPGRNYFLVQGWAADRRSWDVAWGHLIACSVGRSPSETELHACLERVHVLANEVAKSYGVPLLKRGVDVGDRLPEIRRWLVRHPEWLAIRGVEANRKAMPGDLQGVIYRRQQDGGWILYEIDVHEMRQRAQNGFLVPANKPGAAHLPEGLKTNSAIVQHYCATALIPDNKNGLRWSDRKEDRKHHGDWQKRHDFLDCRTYGCALAEYQIRDLTKRPPPIRKYGVVGRAFGG